MSLAPHQERVVNELKELKVKYDALESFIYENEIYQSLGHVEQSLLVQQSSAMREYMTVLATRVGLFNI